MKKDTVNFPVNIYETTNNTFIVNSILELENCIQGGYGEDKDESKAKEQYTQALITSLKHQRRRIQALCLWKPLIIVSISKYAGYFIMFGFDICYQRFSTVELKNKFKDNYNFFISFTGYGISINNRWKEYKKEYGSYNLFGW